MKASRKTFIGGAALAAVASAAQSAQAKDAGAARLVVLYNKPADPAAFDKYYFGTHAPLAKKLPGLREYLVSKGDVAAPGGASPYYFVAELVFDSVAAIDAALGSEQGKIVVADLPNFASAGTVITIFNSMDV
jgi:uncharacterized protein (TIGR02118 family)